MRSMPQRRPRTFVPLPISETELERRLTATPSIRAVARELGMDPMTLRSRAERVIERLRATPCDCGKTRFHTGRCKTLLRSRASQQQLDRRARVVGLILQGLTYREIAAREGGNRVSIRAAYYRHLTPEQREYRAKLQRGRPRAPASAAPVNVAFRDETYRALNAAVPRGIAPQLRDDIISEMYLAVLEGSCSTEQACEGARRFINREIGKWASKFGPASLDEARFDDGDETLVASIPDPAALAAFDQFDNLELGRAA